MNVHLVFRVLLVMAVNLHVECLQVNSALGSQKIVSLRNRTAGRRRRQNARV